LPPDVKSSWDTNTIDIQAQILSYNTIRSIEESEAKTLEYKIMSGAAAIKR